MGSGCPRNHSRATSRPRSKRGRPGTGRFDPVRSSWISYMAPRRPSNSLHIRQEAGTLRASRYDQVASMLVATLLVLGTVTLLMFLIWLSSRITWETPAVPVTVLEDVGGGGSGQVLGSEQQFEEPSPSEVREVATGVPVEQSLDSIATVVATKAPEFDAVYGSPSLGKGEGTGTGDGRGKGPGGPGTSDGIPAYERWEIRMSAANLDEYSKQLDYFKVELGVVGGGSPNVEYVSNLSTARPTVRVGDPKSERRLRFLHRSGELRAGDRQLAAKAGVKTDGRVVFQFYNDATYRSLLALEAERKGNRRVKDVRRTVFGVRAVRGQYEFYVIDQQYLGNS